MKALWTSCRGRGSDMRCRYHSLGRSTNRKLEGSNEASGCRLCRGITFCWLRVLEVLLMQPNFRDAGEDATRAERGK